MRTIILTAAYPAGSREPARGVDVREHPLRVAEAPQLALVDDPRAEAAHDVPHRRLRGEHVRERRRERSGVAPEQRLHVAPQAHDDERLGERGEPGEQVAFEERHVGRADDGAGIGDRGQARDDAAQRVARKVGFAHDPAVERGELGVGLRDDERLEPAGASGGEHVLDERPTRERDDRLLAAEPAAAPAGEDDRETHTGIVVV
jgi:hypothetical protein